jgi:RNA recognition motif-containing protein
MEITFPTYDDSGRSKGYCGVLFTSPKAVEKAVALDGSELHGRWLRIQEGKMYLKKWEEAENIRSSRKEGNERLGNTDDVNSGGDCEKGEYGQKVKRRKKHGFKDE